MQYNQPYGVTDPNAPYINGDPSIGQAGSIPPAASIEYPQREIVNFLTDSGLTPTNSDLHQLSKSVQIGTVMYGIDVGPVNAVAITLTPALAAYVDGQVFRVKIANSNTGPATFNAGPGPVNIVRRGGAVLQAGDLPAGYMTFLSYNATHNNVELYGASFAPATFVPILGANSNLYVNGTTGDDTLYDGTSPTISGAHGPFKTINRAMTETFKYGPSVYTMTINVSAGTYPEHVYTPGVLGPTTIINGAGVGSTFVTGSNNFHTFQASNGNTLQVQNLTVSTGSGTGPPCCFSTAPNSQVNTLNTASGACTGYVWNAYGGTIIIQGNHTFNAGTSSQEVFSSFWGGFLAVAMNVTFTFSGAYSVSNAFAAASADGSIAIPVPGLPTWVGYANVTGMKHYANLNGVINTQGQPVSYFPGTVAGTTASGGQFG